MQAEITLDQETFKALAGEKRIQILKELGHQRKTQTELAQKLALSAPTIAEHLQLLKNAGLVQIEDDGHKWKYYALTKKGEKLLHPDETKIMVLLATSALAFLGTAALLFQRYWSIGAENAGQTLSSVAGATAPIANAVTQSAASSAASSDAVSALASAQMANQQVLQDGITQAIHTTFQQLPSSFISPSFGLETLKNGASAVGQTAIDQNARDLNTWISGETIRNIAQTASQEIAPHLTIVTPSAAPLASPITVSLIQAPELLFLVLITLLFGLLIGYYVYYKNKV
ncbi:MAG: winged helix-turn-helix domain-containing protein [Candidatus Micrarchaeota archaeon]